mmetsp:Transcript_55514/g.120890  ORF Transcript_55514/g.120890 Transcript_55514/m.120890 type:complete len:82 (-) Transcript_55514:319-564(-)
MSRNSAWFRERRLQSMLGDCELLQDLDEVPRGSVGPILFGEVDLHVSLEVALASFAGTASSLTSRRIVSARMRAASPPLDL